MTSGDGWIHCAAGHRHWGRFGAAGLLVTDGDRVILQHRAPWTHEGDTWGIPGGARDGDETVVEAAMREAGEEANLAPGDVIPVGWYLDDHGGWSYTTVLARAARALFPIAANAESLAVEWVQITAVESLALHSGFARTWPLMMPVPESLHLVVADGLAESPLLAQLNRQGIDVARLPAGSYQGSMTRLIPHIQVAGDLMARRSRAGQILLANHESDLALLI